MKLPCHLFQSLVGQKNVSKQVNYTIIGINWHYITYSSYLLGAESIGYPKISQGVFEHGGISFVQMFHRTCNDKLKGEKKDVEETKRYIIEFS